MVPVSVNSPHAEEVKYVTTTNSTASSTDNGLAALAEATAEAVTAEPSTARVGPRVRTSLVGGTATQVSVRAGSHEWTVDEPPALGGQDTGANPVEHLLAALGSCQVITYQVRAAKLGIALDEVEVDLRGELDIRGFFGLNEQVRPGFQSVNVDVRLRGPEPAERYEELSDAVERHCPVLDNVTTEAPVESTLTIA